MTSTSKSASLTSTTVIGTDYEIALCARHQRVAHAITHGDQRLAVEEHGQGPAVVGLHGLTATRRYVLMGSRMLERSGRRVVLYDARGHGASAPAPAGDYSYAALSGDLEAVIDGLEIERALLVGASMGAHTAIRFALEHPGRVTGLALVTPAHDPERLPSEFDRWDALAHGLREGGVDGFIAAYRLDSVPAAWRETVERVIRQRLAAHEHPQAVADALAAVPRSRPFDAWSSLAALEIPTLVVGSRDDADPGHPLAVAQAYADTIPGARLVVEEPGRPPIAWQGGQLTNLLLDF
jgi:pimeloyl-ACP methyl ester carboxylesterase